MVQDVRVLFRDLIAPRWGPVEEANKSAVGDGWALAEQFTALHLRAVDRISAAAGSSPSRSDEATMLLACTGLNVFIETTGLMIRGVFDVSALLLRGLMDAQFLLYACASREELAERYMNGMLKASEARKLLVSDLRGSDDPTLADEFDTRLRDDTDAANDLAHVSLLHADKLVTVESGAITPAIGGRIDGDEARRQSKATLEQEHWLLVSLKAFRGQTLGKRWIEEFDATRPRLVNYLRS